MNKNGILKNLMSKRLRALYVRTDFRKDKWTFIKVDFVFKDILDAFVLNSLNILTWNFQKTLMNSVFQ